MRDPMGLIPEIASREQVLARRRRIFERKMEAADRPHLYFETWVSAGPRRLQAMILEMVIRRSH